jgi:hypothetical protein
MSQTGRNVIKKATNRYGLIVVDSEDIDTLLEQNDKTFNRQKMKVPFSTGLVREIYKESFSRNAAKIFLARDPNNNIHSATFVVYDRDSMHGLILGGDPKWRESGANALLVWHTINFAHHVTKSYDFGGSMIRSIELFIRSFVAVQTPFFNISKDNRNLPFSINGLLYSLENKIKRK